eukprot:5729095-Lingulodinium_polyedra.AAC.1
MHPPGLWLVQAGSWKHPCGRCGGRHRRSCPKRLPRGRARFPPTARIPGCERKQGYAPGREGS